MTFRLPHYSLAKPQSTRYRLPRAVTSSSYAYAYAYAYLTVCCLPSFPRSFLPGLPSLPAVLCCDRLPVLCQCCAVLCCAVLTISHITFSPASNLVSVCPELRASSRSELERAPAQYFIHKDHCDYWERDSAIHPHILSGPFSIHQKREPKRCCICCCREWETKREGPRAHKHTLLSHNRVGPTYITVGDFFITRSHHQQ
ncbi:hypothetical protein HD806DRAFT_189264 [Xylariaceae sp. AK1471]|nr:hypothetical protein HD806DRAFT_189264 [Xylariaceae sp. AK1471]